MKFSSRAPPVQDVYFSDFSSFSLAKSWEEVGMSPVIMDFRDKT
jgi:hypothetical protein